jgi:hypothetical protein
MTKQAEIQKRNNKQNFGIGHFFLTATLKAFPAGICKQWNHTGQCLWICADSFKCLKMLQGIAPMERN